MIRVQLKKHRFSVACNEWHRKIDPLGSAVECFDPIGQARSTYNGRVKEKFIQQVFFQAVNRSEILQN
jgi:hypothetical protein